MIRRHRCLLAPHELDRDRPSERVIVSTIRSLAASPLPSDTLMVAGKIGALDGPASTAPVCGIDYKV
jgi:hypothetical protein